MGHTASPRGPSSAGPIALVFCALVAGTAARGDDSERWSSFLPLLGSEARDRGILLPLPFGIGAVYAGAQFSARPWLEFAADAGADFHGGWYLALIPVVRF